MEERNPILEPENYFAGYDEKIEDLRNQPHIVEFDKLCFELFDRNEQGKRFLELCKERYLIHPMSDKNRPSFTIDLIYDEGFKNFIRMLITHVRSHEQRIAAGNSK
jgi:hypothetical protein